MRSFACPKCGDSYTTNPPDEEHKTPSKYPDRDTIPKSVPCKSCGNLNVTYWKI